MAANDSSRTLVVRYFQSWQSPPDYRALRACLADDVVYDDGTRRIVGAEALVEAHRTNPSPWRDVTILATVFSAQRAALFYEGVVIETGATARIAEHITHNGRRISQIVAIISWSGT